MADAVLPLGFRKAVIYKVNANGRIEAQSDTLVYNGLELQGPKGYALNIPEPRKVAHVGNDRVLATDLLPSQEPVAGEIRVSPIDYDVDAFLMNVVKFTVGAASMIARANDMQGSELQVGLLLYRQALLKATKTRIWHFHLIPSTQCIPIPSSFTENAEDHRYSIAPSPVTKHLWGTAFTVAVEGVTEAAVLDGYMVDKPKIVAFKGDGIDLSFVFSTTHPMTTATYPVWVNGVLQTTGITKTTVGITFTAAPAVGADIIAFGGTANE